MATKFIGFDGLNGIKSELQNLTYTSLHFFNMVNLQKRLKDKHIHPIVKKPWGSGLVEVSNFLVVVEASEIIYECVHHYNPKTK